MARSRTIALVADTHGVLDPRIAALAARCDFAVHAGDVGAVAVLDALQPMAGRVVAVRGNNDVAAKLSREDWSRLAALPAQASLVLPGGSLVVVHGDRAGSVRARHQWLRRHYADARAIVYGHSHRLSCDTAELPWVLNPGAAGHARTFGGPSCLVLTAGSDAWAVTPYRFAQADRG